MASIVRHVVLLTLSVLVLGDGLTAAQARGLRLRGSWHAGQPQVSAAPRRIAAAAVPAIGVGVDRSAPNPVTTGAVDRDASPVQAPPVIDAARQEAAPGVETARVTKVAEPWCRSGRVSGSGAGFCLIN